MKLLLLGKTGGITHWTEDVAGDLRLAGHDVRVFPTRNPLIPRPLERALLSPDRDAPLARWMAARMRRFAPDLILAIGALDQFPAPIFRHLAASPAHPPIVAWIGDVFEPRHAEIAALFDLIAYTDTGLLAMHREYGFRSAAAFVPLGATRAGAVPPAANRDPDLVFVAAPTANRTEALARIRTPLRVVGPNWHQEPGIAHHRLDSRKIGAKALVRYYARHAGVLNIRHGVYVVNGLNQRHFAPYVMGAPVVSDDQPDIPLCFEPGREILVWRSPEELDALYAELRADPARAAAIGAAGQRRVLAEHTYAHRLISLTRAVGLPTT